MTNNNVQFILNVVTNVKTSQPATVQTDLERVEQLLREEISSNGKRGRKPKVS